MKTYKIETTHEVFIDKFNEGELDFVNAYSLSGEVKAENPENAIVEYFKNQLYYDFNMNNAYVPHQEEETETKNTLHYSVLVDNDNNQASGYDVESWKAVIVDGKEIKADTWYKLDDGELVEVKE